MVWCIHEITNVHSYFSIAVVFTVPLCNKQFYYIRIYFFPVFVILSFYFKREIQHSNSAYYQPKAAENIIPSVLSQEITEIMFSFWWPDIFWSAIIQIKLCFFDCRNQTATRSLLHNIHCQSAALPLLKKARDKQTNKTVWILKAVNFGCPLPHTFLTANIYSFKTNLFRVTLPII